MSLEDWMKDDIGDLFDDVSEAAVYKTQGRQLNIQVIAEIGTNDTSRNAHDKRRSYGDASFTVLDDAEKGVTDPHAGDEIVYHGTTYTFMSIEQHNPGAVWRLRFLMHESAIDYGNMWG